MRKKISFSGVCPVQNKPYSVDVEYIGSNSFSGVTYIKGLATCEYNKCGDKCDSSKCPIAEGAPKNIQGDVFQ